MSWLLFKEFRISFTLNSYIKIDRMFMIYVQHKERQDEKQIGKGLL